MTKRPQERFSISLGNTQGRSNYRQMEIGQHGSYSQDADSGSPELGPSLSGFGLNLALSV